MMKEDIHTIYNRMMALKYAKKKPPEGIKPMCRNCVNVELHQWYTGELANPLTCKCTRTGEYNVARARADKCSLYNFNERWESKTPIKHQIFHYPS